MLNAAERVLFLTESNEKQILRADYSKVFK